MSGSLGVLEYIKKKKGILSNCAYIYSSVEEKKKEERRKCDMAKIT